MVDPLADSRIVLPSLDVPAGLRHTELLRLHGGVYALSIVDEATLLKDVLGRAKLGNTRRILLQVLQVEASDLAAVLEGQEAQALVHCLFKRPHNLAVDVLDLALEMLKEITIAEIQCLNPSALKLSPQVALCNGLIHHVDGPRTVIALESEVSSILHHNVSQRLHVLLLDSVGVPAEVELFDFLGVVLALFEVNEGH